MFITSYPRDPGNLELLRKSVSAHAVVSCVGKNSHDKICK